MALKPVRSVLFGLALGASEAARKKSRRHEIANEATGNRGTGLAPGSWTVAGGLIWNGANVDPTFKADFSVGSIDDQQICVDLKETSYVLESNLPAGGYQNVCATYQDVNYGWFDNRKGYYATGLEVCTIAGRCLTRLFLQENNAQIRIYASVYGISQWVVSGGTFAQASAALVQTATSTQGDRGTGLSPGAWTVAGGLIWNGANVDPTFKADFSVRSINDQQICVDLKETSYVLESNLPAGGYQNICATYQDVNYGWFDNRKGYYATGLEVCTVAGRCLSRMFLQENNSQIRIYASVYGVSQWVVSGGTFAEA